MTPLNTPSGPGASWIFRRPAPPRAARPFALAWAALAVTLLTAFAATASAAAESGTAFRYQGRLSDASGPANGSFDLRFALFSSANDTAPVASARTNPSVQIAAGLLTTVIDFGAPVFTGESRWLEVGVRPAGSIGDFVTLSPRQPLTPVPYSLHTLKAEALTGTLPLSQLPTNVARLDTDLTFHGSVRFATNVVFHGAISAARIAGDGSSLSNVSATATALSARLAQRLWRVPIPFVAVTNAGNAPDPETGKGSVPYNFRLGKYEVNNHQYVAFLNAVAADDPNGLYDTNMTTDVHGGIVRSGNVGAFTYSAKPGMEQHPVVWLEFPDMLRFCNWLHHGQPAGVQDVTTTEDGAYTMDPATVWGNTIKRNPGARFWIPSDDEWYKAAYHQPADQGGDPTGYWRYPTRSNDPPFPEEPPGFDNNSANACCGTLRMATDVGAYTKSVSFYGTFDQAGNVEEWTEEIVYVTNRRLRGGSWTYNEFYSKKTDFEFDTPDYKADGIGFRVAGALDP